MSAKKKARRTSPSKFYGVLAAALAAGITVALHEGPDLGWVVSWLVAVNVVALLVYGFDKLQAQGQRVRVPENVLHGLVLVGGWGGGLAGMVLFRHKISKGSFQRVFWAIVILEIAAICAWRFVLYD